MNNNRGGERTIYDESLFRIFLWSGFPIFMILLFACVAISGIVFIYRHSDPEGVKIIIFCFAVLIPVSYGSPFVSLFKAWKQQHKIGIFWKERTDHHLPEWKRDWYLICDRGGFILEHRSYIKRIIGCREETERADTFFDSAVLSALISSCCFVYTSVDKTGFPKLQVIDGANATGIIDDSTGLLVEGYAVLERDKNKNPKTEAYFTKGDTWIYRKGDETPERIKNNVPHPLLVPIVFRPDAVRPFGHSRISRACMDIVNSAMRTVKRSEIAAEFYSFPQKYVVGTDPDLEPINKWKATMSSLLEFTKGEGGDKPQLGQFAQQSMSPHNDQLKMFAGLFAGETGLTLDDLGFVTDNPSSAEAIKASHENLRLIARKAQRTFGTGFLNAGYIAACLRDNYPYERRQFYLTKPKWEPVFEPDAAALSSYGDGAIKINQAIPGYITQDKMKDFTGI